MIRRTVQVDIGDLGELEKNLMMHLRPEVQSGLGHAAPWVVQELRDRSASIRDLGGFQNGWSAQVEGTSLNVWNVAAHWYDVEFGRKPHNTLPPVYLIEAWAQRKLGVIGAGLIIARRIAGRGIPPRPVLARWDTEDAITKIIQREMRKALVRAMEKSI